jgi:hypothetical protein
MYTNDTKRIYSTISFSVLMEMGLWAISSEESGTTHGHFCFFGFSTSTMSQRR